MFPNLAESLSSIINKRENSDQLTIFPLKQTSPFPVSSWVPYVVQFNPESFEETMKIKYDNIQPSGATGKEQKFKGEDAQVFTFEFLLDGTGASGGEKKEVKEEIELFKTVVGYRSEIHRPGFLLLIWGAHIIIAVLSNMNIKYTLHRKNGTPLRATITATFCEHKDNKTQISEQNQQSSDLSSRQIVKDGDKLPLMCREVYDVCKYYLEVARANKLTNFRKLNPGIELDFPPIEKV